MDQQQLCGIIEAILFVSGGPLQVAEIAEALEITETEASSAVERLQHEYEAGARGMVLRRYGCHIKLETRPEYAAYVERLLQPVQKQSLSQAALETLAVVAYKQPVTRSEIEAIRGVKCDYSVQSLIQKRLICDQGRKETLGRPILYGTTDEFLRHFCITSLEELPEIDLTVPQQPPELPEEMPAEAEEGPEAGVEAEVEIEVQSKEVTEASALVASEAPAAPAEEETGA